MRSVQQRRHAFTLAEMLVAISVMVVLVLLITRLINSATIITTLGNKRMDADSHARPLFDRMALDFAQIVKRSDVSYYLKNSSASMSGNDLMAFYSGVQGYNSAATSPFSVVAYRINSDSTNSVAYNRLERMGKGLTWNGVSASDAPIVFLPQTIDSVWPSVTSGTNYDDPNPTKTTYETIGPQVFRFEYYYLERATGALIEYPTAWTSSSTVAIKDVAAIVVAIAVIDPKSRVLLNDSQIAAIATSLPDYSAGWGPGDLLARWQSVLDGTTLPRPAISGIRVYERYFYLSR